MSFDDWENIVVISSLIWKFLSGWFSSWRSRLGLFSIRILIISLKTPEYSCYHRLIYIYILQCVSINIIDKIRPIVRHANLTVRSGDSWVMIEHTNKQTNKQSLLFYIDQMYLSLPWDLFIVFNILQEGFSNYNVYWDILYFPMEPYNWERN